jgi:PAS domain S-box-containing protein
MDLGSVVVLLVEDEAIIAVMETAMLERNGMRVLHASSGEQAIEVAASEPDIRMILMDIDLGSGIDGTEAATMILAGRDLPLVFLSSHTEPEVVARTEAITSYGYILKNSAETVLIASIKMALKLFEAKLALAEQSRDLQTSERNFRQIFDFASVGIVQADPRDGAILACNAKFEEIVGYGRDRILAMKFLDFTHPDDRADNWGGFRQAMADNRIYLTEKRYVRSDGSTIWCRVNVAFLRNDSGQAVRTITIIEDINVRKLAERRLEETLGRYRHAFDNLVEGCQILDKEFRYVYLNITAARHGRKSADELIGKRMVEVYPQLAASEVLGRMEECMRTGQEKRMRNKFCYNDGREAWFDLFMKPMPEGIMVLSLPSV